MACLFSINYNNLPLNLTYIYYSRTHSSTSTTTTREGNRIEFDGQERLIFGFVILDSKITISYPGDHHHDNHHDHQPLAAATNEHGSPGFVRDRAELLESMYRDQPMRRNCFRIMTFQIEKSAAIVPSLYKWRFNSSVGNLLTASQPAGQAQQTPHRMTDWLLVP